jgi:hypothetical protein
MRAGDRIDELPGDPNPVTCFAHRAFQDIANAKLATDPLYIDRLPFVSEARIAGDDKEPADAAECRDDLVDHSIDEIFLLRIAAHILKRQHRDRGLLGQRQTRGLGHGDFYSTMQKT